MFHYAWKHLNLLVCFVEFYLILRQIKLLTVTTYKFQGTLAGHLGSNNTMASNLVPPPISARNESFRWKRKNTIFDF